MGGTRSREPPPECLLNPDILEEIFLNIPPSQVVRVCRLVCRQWREVADTESLWKRICRRENIHLHAATKVPKDWKLFYFVCRNRRNLLKNPSGENKLKSWQILDKERKTWSVQRIIQPHPNENVQTNFQTSCGLCRKAQLIDLRKEGYNPSFMDEFQPDIKITDWYIVLWHCGSNYEICVELLNERQEVVAGFTPEPILYEDTYDPYWHQLTHVFRDYGPGVRYIRFVHGASIRRFWAETSGMYFADTCIEIFPFGDA
ncbi:unnamed protein product [Ophioblennius macclurei]